VVSRETGVLLSAKVFSERRPGRRLTDQSSLAKLRDYEIDEVGECPRSDDLFQIEPVNSDVTVPPLEFVCHRVRCPDDHWGRWSRVPRILPPPEQSSRGPGLTV
jgi:hypothetical protein